MWREYNRVYFERLKAHLEAGMQPDQAKAQARHDARLAVQERMGQQEAAS